MIASKILEFFLVGAQIFGLGALALLALSLLCVGLSGAGDFLERRWPAGMRRARRAGAWVGRALLALLACVWLGWCASLDPHDGRAFPPRPLEEAR